MKHLNYLCYRLKEIFKKPVEIFEIRENLISFCKIYVDNGLKVRLERDFDGNIIYFFNGRLIAFSNSECDIQTGFFLRVVENSEGAFSSEETVSEVVIRGEKAYEIAIEFVSFRIEEKDMLDKINEVEQILIGG